MKTGYCIYGNTAIRLALRDKLTIWRHNYPENAFPIEASLEEAEDNIDDIFIKVTPIGWSKGGDYWDSNME